MLKMICSLRLYRLCDMPAKTKLQKQMLILEWWVQRRRVLSNNGSGRRCSNGVCDQSSRLWSKKNFPWSGKVMISILLWVRREKECCEMHLSLFTIVRWRCCCLLSYCFMYLHLFIRLLEGWVSRRQWHKYLLSTPSFFSSFLSSPQLIFSQMLPILVWVYFCTIGRARYTCPLYFCCLKTRASTIIIVEIWC